MKINEICYNIFDDAISELVKIPVSNRISRNLRRCSAIVYETENYYILRSYNTIIACIDKAHDILIDVLRTEFGYTSTSSQHITKFNHDYCKGYWGCKYRFTSR